MDELITEQRQLLEQLDRLVSSKEATIMEVSKKVIEINENSSSMLTICQQKLDSI
ncbi:TPA: hypothetical protein ACN36B_004379 [Vibrio parahaemolyticus]